MIPGEPAATTRELLLELAAQPVAGDGAESARGALARLALDAMDHLVAVLRPDGTLLEVNRFALEAGGLERAALVGRPLWSLPWWSASPETQAVVRAAAGRAAAGEPVAHQVELQAGGGRPPTPLDLSLRPVRDARGTVALLLAEGRDLTRERASQEALAQANAELRSQIARVRQLDEVKTRFFADVSHELRTPLALVLGPLERVLGRLDPAGDDRQAIEIAARNARTLLRHVNDLLEVARLEASQARLERVEVDLGRLVRLACSHFDALSHERRIDFRVDAPPLAAQVDPDKVERVVVNLVANALEFTPPEGRIRVAVDAADGRARIEVADSGPGIPPDRRQAVFERFRQLEAGPRRRRGGIGLGLAIARDLVELHDGRISVGEAPEGGALFRVDLPLRAPPDPPVGPAAARGAGSARLARETAEALSAALAARPAAPAPAPGGHPERSLVLVVEDNPEMNDFLRSALSTDFRTEAAHDGAEGLRLAQRLRPDLILADVMMPGLGGEAMLAAVRSHPDLAFVPVVFLTARADDALRARLLAEGAQDYVAKPVSIPELRARVGNLTAVKRARDVLQAEIAEQAEDVGRLAEEVARRKRELQTALDSMRFAREQAERASAQKTSLMHLVSHELRTPISALVLQLERLRRDEPPLEERHRQVLDRMRGSTVRLVDLVESLLQFDQIQSGRLTARAEPFDLGGLAAEVADEFRPQAEGKGISVEVIAPPGVPALRSDPRLVRLVLVNLVGNAIKFTDRGSVTVAVEDREGLQRVVVRDTGRGIAPADQARIFEPFEQLETLARKHTPGFGLGLTLVRELVQALGGAIAVESAPGAGSTFTVSFPAQGETVTGAAERR
ncbi:MAG TPA: ATP-binding protein [Anaeromyxobacteraceae bacterium]|nr:ATP-binding protein [Anaeromyxobacteraceae bacterium]